MEAFTVNEDLLKEAAERLGADYIDNVEATAWNESFPTTAGPHRGRIAGQAFTSFQVLGFTYGAAEPIMWCAGVWQKWNGVDHTWFWERSQQVRKREDEEFARLRIRLEISDDHPVDGIEARDATIRGLEQDIARVRAQRNQFRDLLNDVFDHYEADRLRNPRGNAPGHAHATPGIWDDDNGERSGQPCAWCATWNRVTAAVAQQEGDAA